MKEINFIFFTAFMLIAAGSPSKADISGDYIYSDIEILTKRTSVTSDHILMLGEYPASDDYYGFIVAIDREQEQIKYDYFNYKTSGTEQGVLSEPSLMQWMPDESHEGGGYYVLIDEGFSIPYTLSYTLTGTNVSQHVCLINTSTPEPYHFSSPQPMTMAFTLTGTLEILDDVIPISVIDHEIQFDVFGQIGDFLNDYPEAQTQIELNPLSNPVIFNDEIYASVYDDTEISMSFGLRIIPEPTSLVLLGLGTLALRLRKIACFKVA